LVLFLDGGNEAPPFEYLSMLYRRMFHISLEDFNKMPYKTFLLDMEMMNVERAMKNDKGRKI